MSGRTRAPAVKRLSLLQGADSVAGLCVVIDVFRAGTFACHALAGGALAVVPAGSVEEARALKARNPGWILAGERGGVILPGFETGNSPALLMNMDVRGRIIVHATSAGSRGVLQASRRSGTVIMACFSNTSAAAGFVISTGADEVTLLAMGDAGTTNAAEDEEFASFFEKTLADGGRPPDPGPWFSRIVRSGATRRFMESVEPSMPQTDVPACLAVDTTVSVPVLGSLGDGTPALVDAARIA
ncbi:MAG: putative 2-phosphosulfolactate phosphatase [candidate division Hyd24-12 bacterium ADurb.Bin004]|nr:MAG: putative 2-phosphosulfolactate phosphatase [candidate division Hyd24-12 bacterium ADurb.Bin004]HOF66298.1 2-phosphosulfolactate phosphatase [Candidatus Fermentibacter daniensis]